MSIKLRFFLVIFASLASCNKENVYTFLPNYDKTYLNGTSSLPILARPFMEGVLNSAGAKNFIGSRFVLKWNQNKLSFFSDLNGIYGVMDVGVDYKDTTIKLAGYWRSPMIEGEGEIYLKITKDQGAKDILDKKITSFVLEGDNIDIDKKSAKIRIEFERIFSNKVLNNPNFSIIAHRAGGRNSDNIPFAENSLALAKHASNMGASGVEVDVKLTKDNVPIIYHDDDINTRLTMKSPFIGNIEDFNYNFLDNYVRLVDGQRIPTLEEMLSTIIDSTNIRFVWLDNKGGDERFFNYTMPVVTKAIQRAKTQNRTIFIINGIPSEEVAAEFTKASNYKSRPSLCEISLARTKELGSIVYAPRWTLGTLDAEVADAHANNIKVVTWTVDLASVMSKYLSLGSFDGILTNYPSILAYEFYTQE